ncbi:MAG TPA: SidA/IucD/PvdA family monooxygenase [Puia sp.]|jgi:lysine N6-hydroxylase|nr:SidA/IucD/PvdA family monooxygenase [Puia sp.]
MKSQTIYDIVGIGIGPFNLGLAALTHSIPILTTIFFEKQPAFNWHPGLLLPNARLQVPFFADLVTLADPTSPFTYMNFLKSKGMIFRFAIRENNFITRFEYNQYCQWVISQLPNLHFGMTCEAIHFNEEKNYYEIFVKEKVGHTFVFHGKKLVIGVGTVPSLPESIEGLDHPCIFHSTDYLFHKKVLLTKKNITLIGSGQSAAEIFYDLLQFSNQFESISWFTRSEYIFPMDSSKFAFEMTSPDYIDYFYSLPEKIKQKILSNQNRLYKGVNKELIDAIYERLCLNQIHKTDSNIKIYPNTEFDRLSTQNNILNCQFYHSTKEHFFEHETDAAIFATGYKYQIPEFLQPIRHLINWNENAFYKVNKNYSVDNNNSIFVQNADLHSHGFNSGDLGLGPYRNTAILNAILGHEYFGVERNIAFHQFNTDMK